MLSFRIRLLLGVQRVLSYLWFPVIGFTIVAALRLRRHRVDDLASLRRQFAAITRRHRGPSIICANHLTKVDTVLINWALASNWTYLRRFRLFPWNLPELHNISHSIVTSLICYVTKCVPIDRDGPQENKRAVLAKLEYVLRRGESVSIFPEGKRSLTGRLDTEDYGYGVGQLATCVEGVQVICVYLRGDRQVASTSLPARRDRFRAEIRALEPLTDCRPSRRAARDVSVRVMSTLQEMEKRHFARFGEPEGLTPKQGAAAEADGADAAVLYEAV